MDEKELANIKKFLEVLEKTPKSHKNQNTVKQKRAEEFGEGVNLQREIEEKAVRKADYYIGVGELDKALDVLGKILTQVYGEKTTYLWTMKYYRGIGKSSFTTHIEACIDRYLNKYDEVTLGDRRLAERTNESFADFKDDLETIYKDWKKTRTHHNSRAEFINYVASKLEEEAKTERFNRIYDKIYGGIEKCL